MKVVILTAVWGRWKTVDIFAAGVKRLQRSGIADVEVMVVGSEPGKSDSFAAKNGFHYIHADNLPLGEKWNTGLSACQAINPDMVIALGSDDIISNSYLHYACREVGNGYEFVGCLDAYFYDLPTGRLIFWSGYRRNRRGEPIGAGKVFSKSLLNKIDWQLWQDDLDRGLDGSAETHLKAVRYRRLLGRCKPYNMMVLDLKDGAGITQFRRYDNSKEDSFGEIAKYLGKEELRMIKKARDKSLKTSPLV